MMRFGIFGGSFDPIHLGHVSIAIALKEAHALDHVFFIPAKVNPQKQEREIAACEHRLNMIKIALRGVPGCSVLTEEMDRPGPSYMIDTILELKDKNKFKTAKLFLLLGADVLEHFAVWKSPEELVQLCPPLIAQRTGSLLHGAWERNPILQKAIISGMTETPLFDISATEIRRRLKANLYCGHLLHPGVYRYIKTKGLYGKDK